MKLGTLYGIGVGPGAPDLITLRAVLASRVGLQGETVRRDLTEIQDTPPYLSLILSPADNSQSN